MNKFSSKTIDALKYYVYIYSDPDTGRPFYIGKGNGNRAFTHIKDQTESEKAQRIKEIMSRGKMPTIEILAHGLDEETAFKVEAAAIDLIGIENLTNRQRGKETRKYGKIDAATLDSRYSLEDLAIDDVEHNLMLIRINKLYHNSVSASELYEATRGYWKINPQQAKKVEYVLPVYEGLVLEVYEVVDWYPALSTFTSRVNEPQERLLKERYEFIGRVADEGIRRKYVNKSVANFFTFGNANPIKYVWRR